MSLSVMLLAQLHPPPGPAYDPADRGLPPAHPARHRCRAFAAVPRGRRRRAAAIAASYTRRLKPGFPFAPARFARTLPGGIRSPPRDVHRTECAAPVRTSRPADSFGPWRTEVCDCGTGRRPCRVVVWKNPAPSCDAPLKSGLTGMPVSAAAAMKAAERGRRVPDRKPVAGRRYRGNHRRRVAWSSAF